MDHHDLGSLSRPLNSTEVELLSQLDRLKFFLATAPSRWTSASSSASSSNNGPGSGSGGLSLANGSSSSSSLSAAPSSHPALNRFLLPSGEYVSCVLWSGLYHITGTDIVRALVFRFEAFGRPVTNMKKFEEGVFSDLRNLKPGSDACLEEPKVSHLSASAVSSSAFAFPLPVFRIIFLLFSFIFPLLRASTSLCPRPFWGRYFVPVALCAHGDGHHTIIWASVLSTAGGSGKRAFYKMNRDHIIGDDQILLGHFICCRQCEALACPPRPFAANILLVPVE